MMICLTQNDDISLSRDGAGGMNRTGAMMRAEPGEDSQVEICPSMARSGYERQVSHTCNSVTQGLRVLTSVDFAEARTWEISQR